METRAWKSGAAAITQVETITVANTWATGDTGTVTVAGKDLIVTAGTDVATTDIAAALAAAINASSKTENLVNDESRNIGGQEIPEFNEFTAAVSGSTVVLTAVTAGKPFTVSVSETTAGTGTLATATTVAATGPNHANNADNWSGDTLPVDGDTIQFDGRTNEPMKYGLDFLRNGSIAVHVHHYSDYTARIGLPPINIDGIPYPEYRDRDLELYDAAGGKDIIFFQGPNAGDGGITQLDAAGQTINSLQVIDAGGVSVDQPNVVFSGGTIQSLVARRGYLLIGAEDAASPATTIDAFTIGAEGLQDSETRVVFGDSTVFTASSTNTAHSGETICHASLANGGGALTLDNYGGDFTLKGDDLDNVNIRGGRFAWEGAGTFASRTIAVYTDAELDLEGGSGSKTFGTINAYGRSVLRMGRYTAATITPVGCSQEQISVSYYAD